MLSGDGGWRSKHVEYRNCISMYTVRVYCGFLENNCIISLHESNRTKHETNCVFCEVGSVFLHITFESIQVKKISQKRQFL